MARNRVELKGLSGGVQAIVPADVEDVSVAELLGRTMEESAAFLGRAAVTVVLPGRTLTPAVMDAVAGAMALAPEAVLTGVTTQAPRVAAPRAPRTVRAPMPHAGHAIVHSHTLRAGQEIRHGGDVVVLGNVHKGARVIAEGNVIVLGRLEGVAHAGALGDGDRFIYAGRFSPLQVRIGPHIATGPQEAVPSGGDASARRAAPGVPEWAHVEDSAIVVEPWPGGPQAGTAGAKRRRVHSA